MKPERKNKRFAMEKIIESIYRLFFHKSYVLKMGSKTNHIKYFFYDELPTSIKC